MTAMALALPVDFQQPQWLWLCLLVPVLIIASLRSLAGLDPARRVLALVFRSALVILLAACLAGVQYVKRNDDLTVIFLMDRSHSVESLVPFQEGYIREAADEMPPDDRLGVIDFARNAYLEQLPMKGGFFIPPGRLPPIQNTERTDIASAMRLAMAMFPADAAKRIVLMSDGNDNRGDVLTESRRAAADGVPIDVVPLQYEHANEVYFERLIAPAYAEPGEQVPIRMVVNTHRPVRGRIALYQNGRPVPLGPEQSRVELRPGSNTFSVKLPADAAGTQTYEAVFEPEDSSMDAVALNNAASGFTFVSGRSSALLVTSNPQTDIPLAQALESENVHVDMVRSADLGTFGLAHMMDYATIILSNIPAADFTQDQQEELAIYAREMGSGLIMLGGDESFGAGGWIGSPVERVMPVSFEIKHKRVIPRGALVLIMHSCEIPRGNYWGKEMAKKSVETISSQDYVGVVAYTYSPGGENWEVPLDLNTNRAAVKARIDRMQIGDMPDFGRSMQMAYDGLVNGKASDAAQKHVIILSDGDAQPPTQTLLNKYKAAKITVSTIAIGWGSHVKWRTLVDVAKQTKGTYYDARNPRQLPQIFMKESKVVRRPLIIDEPFQPQILHGYSELLGGINPRADTLPQLGGMVLTSPKDSPHVIVPIVRATDDGEDPVLAHWQIGLGKAVAFASGYWPVWGEAWTQWPKFARFWAQIVRWTMRQETPANFDTYTRIDGNRGRIVIDALDKDAGYLNNLQLQATIIGPDNRPIPARFTQRGPGNYQTEFDVEQSGQYLASVQVYDGDQHLGTIRTGLSVPYSPEYRDLRTNEALLRQVADVSGGRWLDGPPETAGVFDHTAPPAIARRPVWDWILAWLIVPAFLLDVATRRLASWLAFSVAVELVVVFVLLFGVGIWHGTWWGILGVILLGEIMGWAIRFRYIAPMLESLTHGVTVLAKAGERSGERLEHLKGTRDRVRGEFTEKAAKGSRQRDTDQEPVAPDVARRRFDVGDEAAAQPAPDLVESLGGARSESPPPKKVPATTEQTPQEDEATTSRLLRAKRKKRDDKS